MNFSLNEDQQAFADLATQFSAKEMSPHAADWDENSHFPVEMFKKAGELGFLGLYTNPEFGGLGLSRLDASIIFEKLAYGDTSSAAFMTIHNMVAWMIGEFAHPDIANAWVPDMMTGEKLGCYCLTEPNAGSDAGALTTKAVRDGDDYLITGQKMFISGAGANDVMVVMARTGGEGPKGVSAFVIPATLDGIMYGKNEKKMGWKNQPTRAIHFNQVRVPAKNILGKEGDGFKFAMKGLDGGRINIATCAVGTAQAALDRAMQYVQERSQFGKTLAHFQSVQFKLADMLTKTVAARQMIRLAAFHLDSGSPDATTYCAMAKRLATDLCFEVANEALQLHGGYGYLQEYPLERHVRDLRVHQILEGTNEIMRVIISRKMMEDGALARLQ